MPFSTLVSLEGSTWLNLLVSRLKDENKVNFANLLEAGAIIQSSGYKTAFYGMGGAFALQTILTFFWMPETAYIRKNAVNLDLGSNTVRMAVIGEMMLNQLLTSLRL